MYHPTSKPKKPCETFLRRGVSQRQDKQDLQNEQLSSVLMWPCLEEERMDSLGRERYERTEQPGRNPQKGCHALPLEQMHL